MFDFTELERKLAKYAKNHISVCLSGKHGVGKTTLVKKAFEEQGFSYFVFNCATLNAHTDIAGVPIESETTDAVTGEKVPCLSRRLPEIFASDKYDALFFDEVSRSQKESLNALFQLIQFKTISGKQLQKLKVIWVAYNPYDPDDDTQDAYHVIPLDPAFKDRFSVHIDIPFTPNEEYLTKKYNIASVLIEWWHTLDSKTQFYCSPRRLEDIMRIMDMGFSIQEIARDILYEAEIQPYIPSLITKVNNFEHKQKIIDFLNYLKNKGVEAVKNDITLENAPLVLEGIKNKTLPDEFYSVIPSDVIDSLIRKKAFPSEAIHKIAQYHNTPEIQKLIGLSDKAKNLMSDCLAYTLKNKGLNKITGTDLIKSIETLKKLLSCVFQTAFEYENQKFKLNATELGSININKYHFNLQEYIKEFEKHQEQHNVLINSLIFGINHHFQGLNGVHDGYFVVLGVMLKQLNLPIKNFNSINQMIKFGYYFPDIQKINKAIIKLVNESSDNYQMFEANCNQFNWQNI